MMHSLRARSLGVRARDDRGLSMVELIVAMGLSSIVLTLVVSFFIQITTATVSANNSRNSTAITSNIANELVDTIRPATKVIGALVTDPAVVAGTANTLTIYTNADSVATDIRPIRVSFSLDSQKRLVEKRWAATKDSLGNWIFPALTIAPASTRTLPGIVLDPSTATTASATDRAPLFAYLDSACAYVIPGSSGLTLDQRKSIAAIEFTVRSRSEGSTTALPATIQNVVGMPNVAQQCKDDS
jgi:prepilin-type N-terminal cleavage/methylation domain-containing protein